MGDQMARGEEFEKKADKKLSGWGLFGSKFEDAADLFEKAANSFKLAKSCNYFFFLSFSVCFPRKYLIGSKWNETINVMGCHFIFFSLLAYGVIAAFCSGSDWNDAITFYSFCNFFTMWGIGDDSWGERFFFLSQFLQGWEVISV